jgi:Mrp family chromosome partitioning ATPase
MSIVDALLKAKQMGMANPALARSKPNRGSETRQSNGLSRTDKPGQRAVAERPAFNILSYDDLTCSAWHIVVPTSDAEIVKAASPPYRMLRARVLQRCRANGWSTLGISSPGPGEGKSVTALNLAFTMAREGNYDVFLLDCDLRNPSICRYLGVTPNREISRYFGGGVAAEEVFFTLAGVERLTIAGGTLGTPQASELLATHYLEELLQYIKSISANPLILIDLPPVVSTDDVLVVAPKVDATVLVVSEGVTRRDCLKQAVNLLAEYQIAGIALNKARQSVGSEYYGA